jgi:hypothetical protein
MRNLDRMDGTRMPIWNSVETGWPFTDSARQGGRRILPAEARAAYGIRSSQAPEASSTSTTSSAGHARRP